MKFSIGLHGFLLLMTLAWGCQAVNLQRWLGNLCPPDRPVAFCFLPPCLLTSCPGYQQATCLNKFCGTCSAIFHDSDGRELTDEECNPTPVQCPQLITDDKLYTIACSDGTNAGSVCNLSCHKGLKLLGDHTVTCLANGNWDRKLTYTRCQAECQPGVQELKCKLKEHPCASAKCPFFPEALCFTDFCEKCGHGFYWNGSILSEAECFQQKG